MFSIQEEQRLSRFKIVKPFGQPWKLARIYLDDSDSEKKHEIRHSIEPSVIYEFVPPTDQSKLVSIDAIDDLQKKSLATYSLKTRVSEQNLLQGSITWCRFADRPKLPCWNTTVSSKAGF